MQETSVAYDALGNIISKTGVGVYQYGSQCGGSAGPHAVCAISAQDQSSNTIGTKNAVYNYDANGNMLSGDGRSITWSLFDKPTQIQQNGNTTLMGYGPDRQLITRQDTTTAGTTSTVFVGGLYEKVTDQNNNIKERHYVGGHTIVTYSNRTASSAGTIETRYLHKDHIGSVVLITDENGVEVESFSFDPWGKRRAPSLADLETALGNWNSLDAFQKGNLTISALALGSDITNKGFTGHEQMDGVNLIHMGGRVYDAEIGRFLSADPFVQDSTNIQALNRYSYVLNNPLSYVDPSGYLFGKLGDVIGDVFKSVVDIHKRVAGAFLNLHKKVFRAIGKVEGLSAALSIGLGVACGPAFAVACTTVFNAAMTAANGGTIAQVLTGAAVGLVSGQMTAGLGNAFGEAFKETVNQTVANVGAAMLVGGAVAKAQGGKFIDGVKGAAVGAAIGYGIKRIMNAVAPPAAADAAAKGPPDRAGAERDIEALYKEGILSADMTFEGADAQGARDAAAKYFVDKVYGVTQDNNIELGVELIQRGENSYSLGEVRYGYVDSNGYHRVPISGRYFVHTHPSGNALPSSTDRGLVRTLDAPFRPLRGIYIGGDAGQYGTTYCGASCANGGLPRTVQ